jgi:coenzyme F420-reducing hydrogenase delta subunit
MRLSYPPNIKIIKLPCTGKIDVLYLLKAFQSGADGVYVAGCMEGDCHYLTGNLRARKRVEYTKKILDDVGIGGERLEMYNMSAAQGPRFVEVANEMTEKIKELGPSPIKKNKSSPGSAGGI